MQTYRGSPHSLQRERRLLCRHIASSPKMFSQPPEEWMSRLWWLSTEESMPWLWWFSSVYWWSSKAAMSRVLAADGSNWKRICLQGLCADNNWRRILSQLQQLDGFNRRDFDGARRAGVSVSLFWRRNQIQLPRESMGDVCQQKIDGAECLQRTKRAYVDIPLLSKDRPFLVEVDENRHSFYDISCEMARLDTIVYGIEGNTIQTWVVRLTRKIRQISRCRLLTVSNSWYNLEGGIDTWPWTSQRNRCEREVLFLWQRELPTASSWCSFFQLSCTLWYQRQFTCAR